MKSEISALMDGELEGAQLDAALESLRREGEALSAWRAYHFIGDALQGRVAGDSACVARVVARLRDEPALVGRLPADIMPPRRARWFVPSAMAASLAAVALVGWMAFAPRPAGDTGTGFAKGVVPATPARAPVQVAKSAPKAAVVVRQPLSAAARDYLLAHQVYSPRNSLQGVAPYVRSVSAEAAPKP